MTVLNLLVSALASIFRVVTSTLALIIISGLMLYTGNRGMVFISTALMVFVAIRFLTRSIKSRQLTVANSPALLGFIPLSLAWVICFYFAWQEEAKDFGKTTRELRAEYTRWSSICVLYYEAGPLQRFVLNRDHAWCNAFPKYDTARKVAAVDTEATATTKLSANDLWK